MSRGLVNRVPATTGRSARDIVLGNLITPFTVILGALLAVTVVIGPIQDAAFGGVLICNIAIGTVQELRAKWTLDRVAILSDSTANVMRNGTPAPMAAAGVVMDDVLLLTAGDQIIADASVGGSDGLEVDEGLVTGEGAPVSKNAGNTLMAGSFVVAGQGWARVTAVGVQAYGQRLTVEARRVPRVHSEITSATNLLLRTIGIAIVPLSLLLIATQTRANDSVASAVRSSIAGMVTLIPQGLVLLTSVAFALAVIRLARLRVVVSELAAVEPLARVDTLCIDKTGTLTTGELGLAGIDHLGHAATAETALLSLARIESAANITAGALRRDIVSEDMWEACTHVPFSASRRWSGASFAGHGTWVLGAPEAVVTPEMDDRWEIPADTRIRDGQRVLVLCASDDDLDDRLPARRQPVAVIGFREQIREGVASSLRYLMDAGVSVKVLSGDNANTVALVAAKAGIPCASQPVDVSALPNSAAELPALLDTSSVFGRVDPHQKLDIVHALQRQGHVVAMTGDGVNDVLALRDADLGIAMGSGAPASRGVARIVLLDGTLDALPTILAEGRRALANIERVASLFVAKTVFACVLILFAAWAALPFPLLLRHLTVVDAAAIGIPGFILALPRNSRLWRPGFLRRIASFAVPGGLVAGMATAVAYGVTLNNLQQPLAVARTVAALVLTACALWLVYIVARDTLILARVLTAAMAMLVIVVAGLPSTRTFFAFELAPPAACLAATGVVAIAIGGMELGWRTVRWVTTKPT